MFELTPPDPRFHQSFLAAVDEFLASGEDRYAGLLAWPADEGSPGVSFTRRALEDPTVFAGYARFLVEQRLPGSPRPAGFVPATTLWMVDGVDYLGRISLRHRLTEPLLTWGGHIGYSVRPSARRRGYATRALAAMLPVAADLGIDPVLVTCDVDNEGSRRAIEKNGGVYEDTRQAKLRFWVPARTGIAAGAERTR